MKHHNDSADDSSRASRSSVSAWIQQLQEGDSLAEQRLWQRYVERLVRLASRKLEAMPRRAADEEDVVLSAFHAFLQGAREHRFPQLRDRNDLWQILVMLTERKAIGHFRRGVALKRGGGRVRGDSLMGGGSDSATEGWEAVASAEPSPEFALLFHEQVYTLLSALPDDRQREIAIAKLEGKSNGELAAELQTSVRSVERKLQLIRRCWQKMLDSD